MSFKSQLCFANFLYKKSENISFFSFFFLWFLLSLSYQYEANGKVEDSMLVNTILMLIYVTKFFLWEAGYWSTMDIAHDRGLHIL